MRAWVTIKSDAVPDTAPIVEYSAVLWDGVGLTTIDGGGSTAQFPETRIVFDDDEHDVRRKVIDAAVRRLGLNKKDVILVN